MSLSMSSSWALRWVARRSCWTFGWSAGKSWQIQWTPACPVLSGVQARSWWLQSFLLESALPGRARRNLGSEPHPNGTDTSCDWQKGRVFGGSRISIERFRRDPGRWPERWRGRKAWPGIRSDHIEFEKPSSTRHLLGFASDDTRSSDPAGWSAWHGWGGRATRQSKATGTGSWWSGYWDLDNRSTHSQRLPSFLRMNNIGVPAGDLEGRRVAAYYLPGR